MPWMHVGQREQLRAHRCAAFTALTAARALGVRVSSHPGGMHRHRAALGFALKHFFLLVPVFLELWLITTCQIAGRPVPAGEQLPSLLSGSLLRCRYPSLDATSCRSQLPAAAPGLRRHGAPTLLELFTGSHSRRPADFDLRCLAIGGSEGRKLQLLIALILERGAFAGAYFFQAKGWACHAYPFSAVLRLAPAGGAGNMIGPSRERWLWQRPRCCCFLSR